MVIKEIVVSRISREPSGSRFVAPRRLTYLLNCYVHLASAVRENILLTSKKRMCCMTRWVCGALTLRMA